MKNQFVIINKNAICSDHCEAFVHFFKFLKLFKIFTSFTAILLLFLLQTDLITFTSLFLDSFFVFLITFSICIFRDFYIIEKRLDKKINNLHSFWIIFKPSKINYYVFFINVSVGLLRQLWSFLENYFWCNFFHNV